MDMTLVLAAHLPIGIVLSLILIGLILLVADAFFGSDALSIVGCTAVAVAVSQLLDFGLLGTVLAGLIAWFATVGAYVLFWRRYVQPICNRRLAPTRYRCGPAGLVGAIGTVRQVEGERMVEVNGDLHVFSPVDGFSDGDAVRVVAFEAGRLRVQRQNPTEGGVV